MYGTAGADPRGRPRGPWPPPSDHGALDHVKSALNFGAKHVKVPLVEGKVLSIWGAKNVKCPQLSEFILKQCPQFGGKTCKSAPGALLYLTNKATVT